MRQIGTTGNLRMACMRKLGVGQSACASAIGLKRVRPSQQAAVRIDREMKSVPAYSLFVEAPEVPCSALQWFRDQDLAPNEHAFDWGAALYFSTVGQLHHKSDGSIDSERSPVVTVHVPQVRRGILWTVGEVRFCPVPLSRFPELERLRRSFLRWFKKFPLIYDHHPVGEHQFDYYLEGSAQNWGPIRGLPSGQIALENGQYFISRNASNVSLETLCRKLSLRGVICADKD